jgi:hypothetical protein
MLFLLLALLLWSMPTSAANKAFCGALYITSSADQRHLVELATKHVQILGAKPRTDVLELAKKKALWNSRKSMEQHKDRMKVDALLWSAYCKE